MTGSREPSWLRAVLPTVRDPRLLRCDGLASSNLASHANVEPPAINTQNRACLSISSCFNDMLQHLSSERCCDDRLNSPIPCGTVLRNDSWRPGCSGHGLAIGTSDSRQELPDLMTARCAGATNPVAAPGTASVIPPRMTQSSAAECGPESTNPSGLGITRRARIGAARFMSGPLDPELCCGPGGVDACAGPLGRPVDGATVEPVRTVSGDAHSTFGSSQADRHTGACRIWPRSGALPLQPQGLVIPAGAARRASASRRFSAACAGSMFTAFGAGVARRRYRGATGCVITLAPPVRRKTYGHLRPFVFLVTRAHCIFNQIAP